ncbi:MAG: hypothetical protein GQ527_09185 [Bacteroidales bacterium]|nr:hypothetical protein [Bacteroidales bacterium]
MNRYLLIILLIFTIFLAQAQENFHEGYVILETQDTIFGKIKDKNYSSRSRIELIVNNEERKYSRRDVQSFHYANKEYVKSRYDLIGHKYFLKTDFGVLNIYKRKRRVFIGAYDSDINYSGIQAALKFYCDDLPNLKQCFPLNNDLVYKDSTILPRILTEYNQWKTQNPNSKSSYEINRDNRGIVNFKISFFTPGVGAEIGLSEKFSFETMLKAHIIISKSNPVLPVWDNQLRFYIDTEKRKLKNRRLYKYTGTYFAIKNEYYFSDNENMTGLLFGYQNVLGKYWYYDMAAGGAGFYSSGDFMLMINLGLGIVF